MNFSHCLSPYCFRDQIVTSCMGLLIKGPWITHAHTEIGGGASIALLNTGIKIWCASTSSTGTRFFERCCHSPEGFIELMQRGPRERESRYLQFTFQRPCVLIYIPHLLAHAVLTLDTGSPTILSGRRHHYKSADYHTDFRWAYFRCSSWSVARNFPRKVFSSIT